MYLTKNKLKINTKSQSSLDKMDSVWSTAITDLFRGHKERDSVLEGGVSLTQLLPEVVMETAKVPGEVTQLRGLPHATGEEGLAVDQQRLHLISRPLCEGVRV